MCVFSCASCYSAAYATKHNFQLPFSQRVAPFTFEFSPRKGQHTHTHKEPLYNLAYCLWDKRRCCRCSRCRCQLRCAAQAEKKNVVENCAIVLQFIGERDRSHGFPGMALWEHATSCVAASVNANASVDGDGDGSVLSFLKAQIY